MSSKRQDDNELKTNEINTKLKTNEINGEESDNKEPSIGKPRSNESQDYNLNKINSDNEMVKSDKYPDSKEPKSDDKCISCETEKDFNNFRVLDSLDVNQILKLLENESKQLKALLLTFLPSRKGRMILEKMGTTEQNSVLERVSRISNVNLRVVSEIEKMFKNDVNDRICKLLTLNGKETSNSLKSEIEKSSTNIVIEKEKKFIIRNPEKFNEMMASEKISGVEIKDKSTKRRHYIYFDTEDMILYKKNITYSIRDRKKDYAITLKLPINGLEEREEYNASINKDYNNFGIDIHNNNDHLVPVKIAKDFAKGSKIIVSERLRVMSTRYRIEPEKGQPLEVSFDRINAEGRDGLKGVELYEIEVENKGADDSVFMRFCDKLSRENNLEEIHRSKYQRVIEHFKKTEEKSDD